MMVRRGIVERCFAVAVSLVLSTKLIAVQMAKKYHKKIEIKKFVICGGFIFSYLLFAEPYHHQLLSLPASTRHTILSTTIVE